MQVWAGRLGSEGGVGGTGAIQMKMRSSPGRRLELGGVYMNVSIEKVSTFLLKIYWVQKIVFSYYSLWY